MSITSIEYVKELAQVLNQNNLARINISEAGTSVSIEKGGVVAVSQKADIIPVVGDTGISVPIVVDTTGFSGAAEIKSPIVGVFYSSPSPDAEPFVSIGDTVKKGDVLGIVEAMKLMNEITCEHDGTILDICAKNNDVVEFGQVLFKIG